jgi:hypothetical protein
MKRLALFAFATASLVACGDDGGGADIDAAIDAPDIDAEIDAPPPTFSGSISLLEVAVLNTGTAGTFLGQGPQIAVSLTSSADVPGPTMQEDPQSQTGCKAWEYTATQAAAAATGADEGVIKFMVGGTTPPMVPDCTFNAGVGYLCPHLGTAGTGGTIGVGAATGTATLADTDNTFSDSNSLGRYLRISGAAMAVNNGVFPIVGRTGANTLIYYNPARMAEVLPAAAQHINIYGLGPIPGAPDPGFLQNDATMDVMLTAGGGNHFATFTSTTGVQTFGDDFTLATAELNKLNAIPKNGSAFTITCDAQGCPPGSATGTVLNIVTTDAPTTALSPYALPLPMTRQVKIRCAVLGASAITVPAAYSALIMGSGATRIQASFIRGALLGGGPEGVSVVAGHATVGFTN